MATTGTDPYGSSETSTAYEGQKRPSSARGTGRSRWSVGIAAVFLVSIVGWLLFHPGGTDPAPDRSAANGVDGPSAPGGANP